jgi:hypothetical protein
MKQHFIWQKTSKTLELLQVQGNWWVCMLIVSISDLSLLSFLYSIIDYFNGLSEAYLALSSLIRYQTIYLVAY